MVLTQAERNYVNASRKFKKAIIQFGDAYTNYSQKVHVLRQERGMGPYFRQLMELNHQLEASMKNKAARTLQRYRRASTMRRRAAAIGSLSRSLKPNLVKNIMSR